MVGKCRRPITNGFSFVTRLRLFRTFLWALTVYVALTALSLSILSIYGQTIIPFYRWELGRIASSYRVQTITFDQSGMDPLFKVRARRLIVSGPYAMLYDVSSIAWAMAGLQHFVLVLLIPLAWPGLKLRQRLLSLPVAIPFLIAFEWADTPWSIVSGLDLGSVSVTGGPIPSATIWTEILNAGGRLALSLAGGLLACGGGYFIEQSLSPSRKTSKRSRASRRLGAARAK